MDRVAAIQDKVEAIKNSSREKLRQEEKNINEAFRLAELIAETVRDAAPMRINAKVEQGDDRIELITVPVFIVTAKLVEPPIDIYTWLISREGKETPEQITLEEILQKLEEELERIYKDMVQE